MVLIHESLMVKDAAHLFMEFIGHLYIFFCFTS